MGDRISIQFQRGDQKSVVLFSHWDGKGLLVKGMEYKEKLEQEAREKGSGYPLHRLEPQTVMLDFIINYLREKERITNNYYLGKSEFEGDNSDNGHHIIKLKLK